MAAEISAAFLARRAMSTEVKTGVKGNWSDWLRRAGDSLGLAKENFEQFRSGKEKTEVKANSFLNKLNYISDQKVSRSADACVRL